jgi:hypothetical protein
VQRLSGDGLEVPEWSSDTQQFIIAMAMIAVGAVALLYGAMRK